MFPLPLLVILDDGSRRMGWRQFHRGIGEGASAFAAIRQHFLDVRDPKVELLLGIIRVFSGDAGPYSLALASELAHVSRDQLILRPEMTIERHLVGERRFRDGLDTDWMDSISIEKIAGDQQDPFARWLRTEIGRI